MKTHRLRLESKIALVTGGTKGIGKAIVLAFLREGASVVFTGSSAEDGPALENYLRQQGHEATFMQCDSRDEEASRLRSSVDSDFTRLRPPPSLRPRLRSLREQL